MNLQEEIEKELSEQFSKTLQEEIDFSILSGMFVELGWHQVDLEYYTSRENAIDISDWVDAHCKGKHIKHGTVYVFENQIDAVNFTLKWR